MVIVSKGGVVRRYVISQGLDCEIVLEDTEKGITETLGFKILPLELESFTEVTENPKKIGVTLNKYLAFKGYTPFCAKTITREKGKIKFKDFYDPTKGIGEGVIDAIEASEKGFADTLIISDKELTEEKIKIILEEINKHF